jgi:hypothetical protein
MSKNLGLSDGERVEEGEVSNLEVELDSFLGKAREARTKCRFRCSATITDWFVEVEIVTIVNGGGSEGNYCL